MLRSFALARMTALFFQKAWDIIKTDLLFLVNSFLQNGVFDKRLNTTHRCLIPKMERPTRITELRPVSLCNIGYKIILKILCQRLKTVHNIGGMGSYLGLPESIGGSKTKIFSFVRDRLQTRINGWSAKFLLRGGKEVMIKSVATTLPTYVMSCFRLPKTITSKLTIVVAIFWWSLNGESRGMHWMAWNKLCSSKLEGGLGFRSIDDFNSALQSKQLWRLITVPDSLFAKVFKGRYYRKSNPLENIKSFSSSYGWRRICSARSLVNKRLIKRVGSGHPSQFGRICGFRLNS